MSGSEMTQNSQEPEYQGGFRNRKWVLAVIGLSNATLWRLENSGKFPRRRQLTPGRVGWLESEVLDWVRSRPAVGGDKVPR